MVFGQPTLTDAAAAAESDMPARGLFRGASAPEADPGDDTLEQPDSPKAAAPFTFVGAGAASAPDPDDEDFARLFG